MVTCVVLIDSIDSMNVTLLRDDKVLCHYIGNLPISHFINDKIDVLKVVFKPTLCNSVPEDAYKIGSVLVNGVNKDCVISYNDFNNLSSLIGKVDSIEIFNYIDFYKDLYGDRDDIVVIDSWNKSLASMVYIKFGQIVDFRRVSYSNLANTLGKFTNKHNCHNVINGVKSYDYVGVGSAIGNLDEIDKDRIPFLKHIPLCLEYTGVEICEKSEILDWSEGSKESNSLAYYSKNIESKDFDLDSSTDIDDVNMEEEYTEELDNEISVEQEEPKKVGFFGRLFGGSKNKKVTSKKEFVVDESGENETKKSKGSINRKSKKGKDSRFSEPSRFGDEDDFSFDDELEDSRFSQLAVGDYKSSRKPNGFNPNVRKYNTVDYLFYIGFICFMSLAFIFGGLQFIYKEKVGILSDTYTSAVLMKNKMESSVGISEDPVNSPVTKVAQIKNLSLPNTYKINNIEYNGADYRLTLTIGEKDSIDNFGQFLPSGLKVSKITPRDQSNGKKIYDISLVVS